MAIDSDILRKTARIRNAISLVMCTAVFVACVHSLSAVDRRAEPDMYLRAQAPTYSSQAGAEVDPGNLIAFVGKRIEVRKIPDPENLDRFDEKFEARYRVLSVIFGSYLKREINFTAFDHYGRPAFARYDTVLLYVSSHRGKFYHEKYQYHAVYPTKDGQWAGCGDPYQNEPSVHRGDVQAQPIKFSPEVTFNLSRVNTEEIRQRFPSQYFEFRGIVAVCKAGVYAKELFEIKRRGVLRARGLFY